MKKSLIALAVLAATGAAMAQSSVTLYGRIDASLGQKSIETTGANRVGEVDQTAIDSSVLNTTFWGLKGTEDLGGGLKANFKLESNFNVDTGAIGAGSTMFERTATVGFSGGFGAVNLGRQYTAYDTLRGATNNVWDSNLATTGDVWQTGVRDYSNRIANSIRYDSPNFGGISGAVAYGFGENDGMAPNLGDATDNMSLHIKYAAGPLVAGIAYQVEKQAQTSALVNQDENKYLLVAGSYDFGMAKLVGGYNQAENDTRSDDEWQVGVSVPFGAFTVAAGYSAATSERSGQPDLDGEGYTLVGTYDLSKRTTLYAGYKYSEVETYSSGTAIAPVVGVSSIEASRYAVGVRHTF